MYRYLKLCLLALVVAAGLPSISKVWAQSFPAPLPAGVVGIACANNVSPPNPTVGQWYAVQCNSLGQVIVSGGGSGGGATPFTPGGAYLNVGTVTTTSANSALPAGAAVVVYNYGANPIMVKLGTSGVTVTAATADAIIQPNSSQELAVGANTFIAYATTAATSTIQIAGGTGLATGWGGGGGGSSAGAPGAIGGGAFQPDGLYTSINPVTTTSQSVALAGVSPSSALVQNLGTMPIYIQLGTSSAVTASPTNGLYIGAGSSQILDIATNTWIAAVTASGTSSMQAASGFAENFDIVGNTDVAVQTNVGVVGDTSAVTAGTSLFRPAGCAYWSTLPTALVTSTFGVFSCTKNRSLIIDAEPGGTLLTALGQPVPALANNVVDPSPQTDGQAVSVRVDSFGDLVQYPFAPHGLHWSQTCSGTGTTLTTCTGTSSKTNYFTYITDITCYRTDAATGLITVTLNDVSAYPIPLTNVGGGGAFAKAFNGPLKINTVSTAVTYTLAAGVTTVSCSLEGFYSLI